MDHLPYATPPRWWSPCLAPRFVHAIAPARRMWQRRRERVRAVEVRGLGHLRGALARDQGVLITPNHAAHSDPFVMLAVGDRAGRPFYYIAAWQSFQILSLVARWMIRLHGCFSIDREGSDLRAFRRAVAILQQEAHPLVIFPEGELYHNADQVVPFREGAAAIALAAARRAPRPVVCLPAAIRYRYVEDPTPELDRLTQAMERKLRLTPRPGAPLAERLAQVAEAVVSRHERTLPGGVRPGPFPLRIAALVEAILRPLEERYGVNPADEGDVPGRVTRLRRLAIQEKESRPEADPRGRQARRDLDALLAAVRLFSYANDYLCDRPSVEHLAEIVDKFEEDLLGVVTARPRAARRVVVLFGAPIAAGPFQEERNAAGALTRALEREVRGLLAELAGRVPAGLPPGMAPQAAVAWGKGSWLSAPEGRRIVAPGGAQRNPGNDEDRGM
jgi:hypothetical protein